MGGGGGEVAEGGRAKRGEWKPRPPKTRGGGAVTSIFALLRQVLNGITEEKRQVLNSTGMQYSQGSHVEPKTRQNYELPVIQIFYQGGVYMQYGQFFSRRRSQGVETWITTSASLISMSWSIEYSTHI